MFVVIFGGVLLAVVYLRVCGCYWCFVIGGSLLAVLLAGVFSGIWLFFAGFIGGSLFACWRLLLAFCNWREFVGGFLGGRFSEFYWRFLINVFVGGRLLAGVCWRARLLVGVCWRAFLAFFRRL